MSAIRIRAALVVAGMLMSGMAAAAPAAQAQTQAQSLEELRNTVINLLEALVQKGVMSREQAEAMVANAQGKAQADAAARAAAGEAQAEAEKDAVRVTYVPEIVQQQISEKVQADIRPAVVADVKAQARSEGWGVPGALPEWIGGVRLYGDVRVRGQSELYADDNAAGYPDFQAINDARGVGPAGLAALLNVSEDRARLAGRARIGLAAELGSGWRADFRLASGNLDTPVSTNQTLGSYGRRWAVGVDRASIAWNPVNAAHDREFELIAGRFANPFVTVNELLFDNDLMFDGVALTYAMDLFGRRADAMERGLFITAGAFPLQEVALSSDDKWLLAGQLGGEFWFGERVRLRATAGYFDFRNIAGTRNAPDSRLLDFTAPRFVQKGNTLFDIDNDDDPLTNLYALAGDYRIVNGNITLDIAAFGRAHVILAADYVRNLGWKIEEVIARAPGVELLDARERTEGYDIGLIVGHPQLDARWAWRAFGTYRYLQRDAVLDAFTDSDFHLGGTDAQGYQFGLDLGLTPKVWLRARYLSANEIDGPALGIDVLQVDLNARF